MEDHIGFHQLVDVQLSKEFNSTDPSLAKLGPVELHPQSNVLKDTVHHSDNRLLLQGSEPSQDIGYTLDVVELDVPDGRKRVNKLSKHLRRGRERWIGRVPEEGGGIKGRGRRREEERREEGRRREEGGGKKERGGRRDEGERREEGRRREEGGGKKERGGRRREGNDRKSQLSYLWVTPGEFPRCLQNLGKVV